MLPAVHRSLAFAQDHTTAESRLLGGNRSFSMTTFNAGHVLVEPDRDGELADSLQRLVQLDLAAINIEYLLGETVRDIAEVAEPKSWSCSPDLRVKVTDTPSNCFASSSAWALSWPNGAPRRPSSAR